jgi:predicted dehydrogenase
MLHWLVVGIGDISTKRVLPAILAEPRSRLAGIVTRTPEKAAPWLAPAWTTLDAALAECPADAVYIATPVFLHAPQTIAALRAGRHVLCEKPMALSYQEAASMQNAAAETGRTLGIAYYRRMYPKVERARALMDADTIGRPFVAEATAHDWVQPAGGPRSWLIDPAKSGAGPLYDVACHRIDLMNYLFGEPVRASAHRSTLVQQMPVEDNATVMIEYRSGVRGIVDVRWHSRVPRDEFRIRGTEGELDLSPLNSPHLAHPGGIEHIVPHDNIHYPCVEDFVTALCESRPPRSSSASALQTEWVLHQALD